MRYRSLITAGALLSPLLAFAAVPTFEVTTNQLKLPVLVVDKQSAWRDLTVRSGQFSELRTGENVPADGRPEFTAAAGLLTLPQVDVLEKGALKESLRGVSVKFRGADSVAVAGSAERKDLFALSGWELQTPVNKAGEPSGDVLQVPLTDDVAASQTPCLSFDGLALVFKAPSLGAKTANASGPRCELREIYGSNAEWLPAQGGSLALTATVRSVSVKSDHATVAQVLASNTAIKPFVMIKFRTQAGKAPRLDIQYRATPTSSATTKISTATVAQGQPISYVLKIYRNPDVTASSDKAYVLDVSVDSSRATYFIDKSWADYPVYFKLGAYHDLSTGDTSAPASLTDVTEVSVHSFAVSHP